jgi:DNA-binding NarL/FixJ family response regulator
MERAVVETRPTLQDVFAGHGEPAPEVIVLLDMTEVASHITRPARPGTSSVPIIKLGYADSETCIDELVRRIERAARSGARQHRPTLTHREREIGNLLTRGLSNGEIAAVLEIEIATVKNHVHSVLEKLGVHRRTEAARFIQRAPRMPSHDAGRILEA